MKNDIVAVLMGLLVIVIQSTIAILIAFVFDIQLTESFISGLLWGNFGAGAFTTGFLWLRN